MTEKRQGNSGLLRLIAWVTLGIAYLFVMSGWVIVTMNDKALGDYLSYVVDYAGAEHRPAKEIRSLILVKAENLTIPLDGEQIQITGEGKTLRAVVQYQADVRVPLVNWKLYRKTFSHNVAFKAD